MGVQWPAIHDVQQVLAIDSLEADLRGCFRADNRNRQTGRYLGILFVDWYAASHDLGSRLWPTWIELGVGIPLWKYRLQACGVVFVGRS